MGRVLTDVVDLLACPECGSGLELDERALVCEIGHTFDVARQGYVSLLTGAASKFTGDTPEMIADRSEFLAAGHFDALMAAVAEAAGSAARGADPRILEVGAGTGQYLARVLDAVPTGCGIGLDVSKAAARRIARCHPRAGAVVADVWQQLPVRQGTLTEVLSIFAPRNAREIHRVLADDGVLIVLTPTERHLRELVRLPGMVRVDERKTERLSASMSGLFDRIARVGVEYPMTLAHPDVARLLGMGPSAHHITGDRRTVFLAHLPEPFAVTASVVVSTYQRLASTP